MDSNTSHRDTARLMEPLLARWLIQLRLGDGRLPCGHPTDLRERPGDGQSWCDGCGLIITKGARAVTGIVEGDWRAIRLHLDCFRVWEAERLEVHEHRQ
jgi:hypothetical protein